LFEHVLTYLREGVIKVDDIDILRRLKHEFDFYDIDMLVKCDHMIGVATQDPQGTIACLIS
jgi:hypothetical protein